MEKSYSLSDIAALLGNRNDGFLGNGTGLIVLILFFLIFGFNGNWGNRAFGAGVTEAQLAQSQSFQDVQSQIRGLTYGLSSTAYENAMLINNNSNTLQRDIMTGFTGTNANISNGNAMINSAIAGIGSQLQTCCCNQLRAIDGVNYNNAINTNTITANATANTQAILDRLCQMEANAKDQRIADLTAQLQNERFANSQFLQNQYLVNTIGPKSPIPAYQVANPYSAYNGSGCSCYSG